MDEKLFNRIFEILNCMAGSGEILWKIHFDTCIGRDGNYILRLNYKALTGNLLKFFYDNYIRSCENSLREGSSDQDEAFKVSVISMGINPNSLREELKRKSYCINCSYSVNFYPRGGEERKLIYRSALLDIYKLQTAGVNIDHMLSDNRQER